MTVIQIHAGLARVPVDGEGSFMAAALYSPSRRGIAPSVRPWLCPTPASVGSGMPINSYNPHCLASFLPSLHRTREASLLGAKSSPSFSVQPDGASNVANVDFPTSTASGKIHIRDIGRSVWLYRK